MTIEELINTFGNTTIYNYRGKKEALREILISLSASHNYVIDDRDIYFASETKIEHELINVLYSPVEESGE